MQSTSNNRPLTRDEMTHLDNNVSGVALVFEGGGMRCSYSSAILAGMLRAGIFIDYVTGISGGSSCVVNYVTREPERARKSFVDIAADPQLGNYKTFLKGKGWFHSDHIYDVMPQPDGILPLDFERMQSFGTRYRIGSFNLDRGETQYWSEQDVDSFEKIIRVVKASSSLPILMPPVSIDGVTHVDGAIGANAGIPLDIAREDGYEKFVFVLTQPRDFTKMPLKNPRLIRAMLRRQPGVADALMTRYERYNAVREQIIELEAAGKAFVFWADDMMVGTSERNVARLAQNYELGAQQFERELPALKEFLGV